MPIGNKNQAIPGGGTHHIAVQTRDWDESLKFYRDLLGMTPVVEFGTPERRILLLDVGDGSHIEIFQPKADTPTPGSAAANDPVIHFALTTTDLRGVLERVRAAGCTVTAEPRDITLPNGWDITVAFFLGPSGESIELLQTHN